MQELTATLRRIAQQVAAPPPDVAESKILRDGPRSIVRRLELNTVWQGRDRLIAKQAVGAAAERRFAKELAALRFLTELALRPPVAPTLLAWDRDTCLFIVDDLGDHGMATAFQGGDRTAAHTALIDYAVSLGRLHGATIGHESRLVTLGHDFGLNAGGNEISQDVRNDGFSFRKLCEAVGISVDSRFDDDVRHAAASLAAPGSFRALTHGDPCPDNERRTISGVAFLDFEASGFGHALLDASYLTMAFPTCWCVGSLPAEAIAEALIVYRQALASGTPAAMDDEKFARHLLYASARWLIDGGTLVPCAQRGDLDHFSALLARDWKWGPSTARQRFVHRLAAFVNLAQNVGELGGLAATAIQLQQILMSRWPTSTHRLPAFFAFGG